MTRSTPNRNNNNPFRSIKRRGIDFFINREYYYDIKIKQSFNDYKNI